MDYQKDPEPASPSGNSEAARPRILSSNERALFDELFRALDCLVLERSTASDAFRPIHMVPEWAPGLITMVSDQRAQDLWVTKSDFLEFYIRDANQWWDQHEDGVSGSIPWEETGPAGGRLDFEVATTAIGTRKLLVIKRLAPSLRAYIQLMRDKRLFPQQSSGS